MNNNIKSENGMPNEESVKPSSEIEELDIEINFNYEFADEKLTESPLRNIFTGISTKTDTNDLNLHVKETHDERHVFPNCRQTFFTGNQLFTHKESIQCLNSGLIEYKESTQSNSITCKKCNKSFTNKIHYNTHLRTHIETEQNVPCLICGNKFLNKQTLKSHLTNVHSGKQNVCSVCFKTFSKNTSLKDHMNLHNNTKPFKCTHCEEAFFTRNQRYIHRMTNKHFDPRKCNTCSKSFATNTQLRDHLKTHPETTEEPPKKATCCFCNQSFAKKSSLKQHMNRHIGQKSYECALCRVAFFNLHQLYVHKNMVHSTTCRICNKSLSSKYTLSRHLKTHLHPVTPKTPKTA